MIRTTTLIALAVSLSASTLARAAGPSVTATYNPSAAMKAVQYSSDQGDLKIFFPSDVMAGDTISGTVFVTPKGATEAERAENDGILRGCVIDVEGSSIHPAKGHFTWTIPSVIGAGGAMISLIDAGGKTLASQCIPILPPNFVSLLSPSEGSIYIPPYVQAGEPVSIKGGHMFGSIDRVTLDGVPADSLASSPRQVVIGLPTTAVGQHEIKYYGDGGDGTAMVNILKVNLSAPKTSLMKGDKTEMKIQVSGMAGMNAQAFPVQVQITNLSPAVVMVGHSDTTVHPINAKQVGADGTATFQETITSTQAGTFTIKSSVVNPFLPVRGQVVGQNFWEKAGPMLTNRGWDIGPSLDDLSWRLQDMRDRKAYDWAHGRRYQAAFAAEIEKLKHALRSHHGRDGEKAAMNEPGDYDPPR